MSGYVPRGGPDAKCRPVVQVFSATMARERESIGLAVTTWLKEHREVTVCEIRTMQSSDSQFHCITVVVIGEVAL